MTEMSGLQTALSALQAQSRALATVGNNIANASTDGYSRQRADLQSVAGPTVPALWSRWTGAGQGVTVTGISRSTSPLADAQVLAAHGQGAALQGQSSLLSSIEDAVGEPSDTGLSSSLTAMWGAFSDVANHPSDIATRTVALQDAGTVTQQLGGVASQLSSLWQDQRAQLTTMTSDVNSTAAGVARLNGAIRAAVASGQPSADLADQRDTLIRQLGEVAGVTTQGHPDGTVDVLLGGSALVSGSNTRALGVSGTSNFTAAGSGSVSVTWTDSGTAATVSGGSLGAALDGVNTVLPTWRDRVDGVAAQLTSSVNAVHLAGYDLDGNAGGALFTGTTAATIQVAITDPRKVAASSSATSTLDNGNALDLSALSQSTTGADAAWRSAVSDLGVRAQSASRQVTAQQAITTQADAVRESVSGVSIDEEMTSLLQYQHGYEAASKYMNTLNETMQQLMAMVI